MFGLAMRRGQAIGPHRAMDIAALGRLGEVQVALLEGHGRAAEPRDQNGEIGGGELGLQINRLKARQGRLAAEQPVGGCYGGIERYEARLADRAGGLADAQHIIERGQVHREAVIGDDGFRAEIAFAHGYSPDEPESIDRVQAAGRKRPTSPPRRNRAG